MTESKVFPRTVKALEVVEDLLRCHACKTFTSEPVSLHNCDHMFCCSCIKHESKCPTCTIPLWVKDKTVSRKLQNVAKTCLKMKHHLDSLQKSTELVSIPQNTTVGTVSAEPQKPEKHKIVESDFSPAAKVSKNIKTLVTPKCSKNVMESTLRSVSKSCQKNKKGESNLHLAAINGKIQTLTELIKDGANVNAKDNAGWSPLHEACIHGFTDIVQKLLDSGAFIDIPGHRNDTPLMDAVANHNVETVKLLIQHGANVNLRNAEGKTAKSFAKSHEIIELLSSNQPLSNSVNTVVSAVALPDDATLSFSASIDDAKVSNFRKCMKFNMVKKDAISVTHFIAGVNESGRAKRTLKYLQAMACGAWILSEHWVDECITQGKWLDESSFQVKGSLEDAKVGGPLRSTTSRLRQVPRLFDGCHFYLHGKFSSSYPSKIQLGDLIKAADGMLLVRSPKPDSDCVQACTKVPYHAMPDTPMYFFTYYIVYDPLQTSSLRMVQQGKVCTVSVSWLLNCLSQFDLSDIL
uniref:BRCA1-associated RING domain protein 1-like n=1 Tax=Phallusia mammillata TaxID=59560 RepID=A0A6F9D7M0_9ASCI|nr:BRCA1-associated RING domain protein 1-like [Phallusia mammillata]